MKKFTILPLLLLIAALPASSQKIADFMNFTETSGVPNKSVVGMEGYTGNPYVFRDFSKGSITAKNGTIYQNVPLRYNIYNDVMEYVKDDIAFSIDPKKFALKAEIEGQMFVYTEFNYPNPEIGYLEVLTTGNYSLFKRYRVRYHKPEPAGAYSDAKQSEFETMPANYFIKVNDGEINFIPKAEDLLNASGEHAEALKAYIKKNKLKYRKEMHIIQMVSFLNTL